MLANILIVSIGFILGYLFSCAFGYRRGVKDIDNLYKFLDKPASAPDTPYNAKDISIGGVKFPGYTVLDNNTDKNNNKNEI